MWKRNNNHNTSNYQKKSANENRSIRQRWHYFSLNVIAFAAVFLALGVITIQILHATAYSETDISLRNLVSNTQMISDEIQRSTDDFVPRQTEANHPEDHGINRFNSQVVLWSADGEILNQDGLGDIYSQITSLDLSTENLDEVEEVTITDENQGYHFRTITSNAPENTGNVAYITVLSNTDQIDNSVANFQNILIISLIFFWLISIGIAYYLSIVNMKPILKSWKKQQEFVENASHELRTPLTIIQNNLDHLFTKPHAKIIDESERIAQALNETRRLTGLTTDLLTIARGDANEQTLDLTLTDIQPFIKQTTDPFRDLATLAGKEFNLFNNGKAIVKVDQKKIHQVLVILLDNALKYTQAGDTITVDSHTSKRHWYIYVKNTGSNIADEDKDRIFERFYRDSTSRASETSGYGLGLAIAKQIIEDHQGTITVEDGHPHGVIFAIRLRKNYD
ncbi:sensor histidine kinase [Aerococcus sp. NPDC058936]|uniref:sensor histidine kinase n=1 Tax=Aerococcus sp. NPDC058936 TaxID=3346674 RepID=UPI00366C2B44